MRSRIIANWACALLSFGVVLGLGPVQAGVVLTVDFSNGPTFQTFGAPIDQTFTLARFGTARGAVDASLGVMKATDVALPPRDSTGLPNGGFYQVNTFLTDTYHLMGNAGSMTIPFHLTADGMMTLPGLDAQGDANGAILTLTPGNGGVGTNSVFLSSNPTEAANGYTIVVPGTYAITETSTYNVTFSGSQGQSLTSVMSLHAVGGAALDFFSTAQISFDLPPGMSITSDGGFFQTSGAAVPEPSTGLLIVSAMPIIAGGFWFCSRRPGGRSS